MSDRMLALSNFMMGAMAMASGVIGLFFFRFWRRTADKLFLIFAGAFWVLGITRLGLVLTNVQEEGEGWYALRLVAFLMILYAIWDKNRPVLAKS